MANLIDCNTRFDVRDTWQAEIEASILALGAKMRAIMNRVISEGLTSAAADESEAVLAEIKNLTRRYHAYNDG
jgi:hypothetical protein